MPAKDEPDGTEQPAASGWLGPSASAGAGAASALIGFALGGPPGAVAGAAATPLLTKTFETVGGKFVEMSRRNGERVLAIAAAEANAGVDELAEKITADERRLQLAGMALAAGSATTFGDKIRALGRALAAGVTDDATVDVEMLIVAAVTDLEAPHVKVLRHVAIEYASLPFVTPPRHRPVWQFESLARALPEVEQVLLPVLATLQRHGLLEKDTGDFGAMLKEWDSKVASGFGSHYRAPKPVWRATDFGVQVLELLTDAAEA